MANSSLALSLGVLGFLHKMQGMQQATSLAAYGDASKITFRSVIGVAGLVEA